MFEPIILFAIIPVVAVILVFLVRYIYGGSLYTERDMNNFYESAREARATPAKTPVNFVNFEQMRRPVETDDELRKWANTRMNTVESNNPDFDVTRDGNTLFNMVRHSQGTVGISELDNPQFRGAAYKVPLNSAHFGAAPHSANVTFARLYPGTTGEPKQLRRVNFNPPENHYPERTRPEYDPGRRFSNTPGFQKNQNKILEEWKQFTS